MAKVKRKYWSPCRGYMSSVPDHLVPPDYMSADSRDWLVSPRDGRLIGRKGTLMLGDVPYDQVGLLESGIQVGAAKQIVEMRSPSLGVTASPSYAAFYGNESWEAGATLYFRAQTGSADATPYNYNLMAEFNTTYYPQAGGVTQKIKSIPLPYTAGAGTAKPFERAVGYTRGSTLFLRARYGGGTRRLIQAGDWVYLPSLYGMPFKWNKRFNKPGTTTGTEPNRTLPWGRMPALSPPTLGFATVGSSGTDDRNWKQGDSFYFGVVFQYEDGSFSMPFIPRPKSATLTSGLGFFQLGGVVAEGSQLNYRSFSWQNIPRGGDGVIARYLVRTGKVNVTTASSTQTVGSLDLSKLKIIAVLRNNTQTDFIDEFGNDGNLVTDDRAIRFDHIWPPAARYAFEFDGRIALGHTRVNPAAIILAPTGVSASRDLYSVETSNPSFDNITLPEYGLAMRVLASVVDGKADTLQLRYFSAIGSAPDTTAITLSATKPIKDVVDEINATAVGGNGKEWAAQLAPGADGTAPSNELAPTSFQVSGCTIASTTALTTSVSNGFRDVAIGMLVTGTGIPADTYISAKSGHSALTLSQPCTNGGPLTFGFHVDVGDDFLTNDGSKGHMRSVNAALPVVLCYRAAWLEALPNYEDERNIFFTAASPGDFPMAAESFFFKNRRTVPADMGRMLGASTLNNGAVVWYENGYYVMQNRKGGTTGEDQDFRLYAGNKRRKVRGWDSIVTGDDWGGAMTEDGYIITSGAAQDEVIISGDIWDPGTRTGAFDYELKQSAAEAAIEYPAGAYESRLHACVKDGALHLTYRSDSNFPRPNRRIKYDFSPSIAAAGVAEVLRPDGSPYPWSSPLPHMSPITAGVETCGPMGYFTRDDQTLFLGARSWAPGGEIQQLDTGRFFTGNDEDDAYLNVSCTWTSGNPAITVAGGLGAYIAVGSYLGSGINGVAAGATVLSKNAAETEITISASPTGNGSGSIRFYGVEIQPVAYGPKDFVEEPRRKKSAQSATVIHRNAGGVNSTLSLLHSRDKARATEKTYALAGENAAYTREIVPFAQEGRALAEVHEVGLSHDGRGTTEPELDYLEVEFELGESVT